MGCSSSSAQTVEQENMPGTKPEESNKGTFAIQNGSIAENMETIEDQVQLPVQTALPGGLKPRVDDEAVDVLAALEAQGNLGSGENLFACVTEQQPLLALEPEPVVLEEIGQEALENMFPRVEALTETLATMVEAVVPVVEATATERVVLEAPPKVEAISEAAVEPVVKKQTGLLVDVEEATPVQVKALADVDVPVKAVTQIEGASHTKASVEVHGSREASEPVEVAIPAHASSPPLSSVPVEASVHDAVLPVEASVPTEASLPVEASVPVQSGVPVEVSSPESTQLLVDAAPAAANSPEVPPVSLPAAEEAKETPAEPVPPAEALPVTAGSLVEAGAPEAVGEDPACSETDPGTVDSAAATVGEPAPDLPAEPAPKHTPEVGTKKEDWGDH